MADRVKVTDPYSGTVLTVKADSPQAKLWGKSSSQSKTTSKKSSSKSDE